MTLEETIRAAVREELAVIIAELRRPDPGALTQEQLGGALQISRSTVHRLLREGMPHYLVLGSKRFDLDEVKAWLKTRG